MNSPVFLTTTHNENWETRLAGAALQPAWTPFDPRAVAFTSTFSRLLLTHPNIRTYPELAALGHWFRVAHLRELQTQCLPASTDSLILGRGLAFHLAPANVDSISVYSCLISLLAGNTNWVRVSQHASPQFELVLQALNQALASEEGRPVSGRMAFLTYPHDDEITTSISQQCHIRVIWGGDETIATVRRLSLRPTATEICFPDRFSLAALNADKVLRTSADEFRVLIDKFYNDVFWFSQQACSSPRLIVWVGNAADCSAAQTRFWAAFNMVVQQRQPQNTPAMNMARLASAFEMAATEQAHSSQPCNIAAFPMRLTLERPLAPRSRTVHCGHGVFYEFQSLTLADISNMLTEKDQSMSIFGFCQDEIVDLIHKLPPRALDRIVHVGQALAFSPVWDGTNLFTALTRCISLPPCASFSSEHITGVSP